MPNMEGDVPPRGDCRGDGPEMERTDGRRLPMTALWHSPVRGAVPGAMLGAVPSRPSGAHRPLMITVLGAELGATDVRAKGVLLGVTAGGCHCIRGFEDLARRRRSRSISFTD